MKTKINTILTDRYLLKNINFNNNQNYISSKKRDSDFKKKYFLLFKKPSDDFRFLLLLAYTFSIMLFWPFFSLFFSDYMSISISVILTIILVYTVIYELSNLIFYDLNKDKFFIKYKWFENVKSVNYIYKKRWGKYYIDKKIFKEKFIVIKK